MIPGDIEIDLYRISNGEPIRWKGMSSAAIDRVLGYVLFVAGLVAGALLAYTLAAIGFAAVGGAFLPTNKRDEEGGLLVLQVLVCVIACFQGLVIAWEGRRIIQSAGRVVWAITSKRLIRIISGEPNSASFWTKDKIVKVVHTKWVGLKSGRLAVTVRISKRRRRVLSIIGPADLDMAERALSEMED